MAAWLSGYSLRRKLSVDHLKVDSDLVDFPVDSLLSAANFDFAKSLPAGEDIRYCGSDGTTLLSFERGRHEQANSRANYQTKLPAVSSAAPTDYYQYQRTEATADGANPTAVWDANTMARWSLKEDPSGIAPQMRDSTVNANHGSSAGSMTSADSVEGKIGKALDFDGVNDRVNLGNPVPLQFTGSGTLEGWFRLDVLNTNQEIVIKGSDVPPVHGWGLRLIASSSNRIVTAIVVTVPSTVEAWAGGTTTLSTATWYYGAAVWNSGVDLRVYLNGIAEATTVQTGHTLRHANDSFIGSSSPDSNPLNGIIDETRISNIARSLAWIKASFNSGNNTLLTYGAEETAITYQPRGTSLSSPYMY